MPPFLISFLLQFKTQIISAVVLVGLVFGVWLWHSAEVARAYNEGVRITDSTWVYRVAHAPVETKVDTMWRTHRYKDTTGVGTAIAQGIDSARKAYTDSLMQYKSRDSMFYALSQKQEFKHEIKQDSVFRADYVGHWDPLHPPYTWELKNIVAKERIITVDNKSMVPIPFKRLAIQATLGGAGDLTLGASYRLGTDKDLSSSWNSYSVGAGYQVAGPKANNNWYTPIKITITGFIE